MRLNDFLTVPLLLLLLSGCGGVNYDNKVGPAIAAQVQQNKLPIKIADLTDFKWEKVYAFGAYTGQEDVDRALGFHWSEYDSTELNVSDRDSLLVFVANGKVIKAAKYAIGAGVFAQTATGYGYTPQQAVFSARTESGITLLMPVEQLKQPKIAVREGLQPGIYIVEAWVLAPAPGQAFLKVFNTQTNQRLSADRLTPRSTQKLAWHNGTTKSLSPYSAEITIYEGDWSHQYEARFELWHRSTNGKEQQLISTTHRVNGWER